MMQLPGINSDDKYGFGTAKNDFESIFSNNNSKTKSPMIINNFNNKNVVNVNNVTTNTIHEHKKPKQTNKENKQKTQHTQIIIRRSRRRRRRRDIIIKRIRRQSRRRHIKKNDYNKTTANIKNNTNIIKKLIIFNGVN